MLFRSPTLTITRNIPFQSRTYSDGALRPYRAQGKVTFLALTKPDLAAPGRGVFVTHRERIFSLPQGRQIAIWTPFFKALIPPLVWSRCRG